MTPEQKSRISDLLKQCIQLDLQEISYWKKTADRNTYFAKRNVEQAMQSIKDLTEIKNKFA